MAETYITIRALCAVAVIGNQDRPGTLLHIPEKSQIRVCGRLSQPGMIEIEWLSARYMVFGLDLHEKALPLPPDSEPSI
jgi:hypothetical protein